MACLTFFDSDGISFSRHSFSGTSLRFTFETLGREARRVYDYLVDNFSVDIEKKTFNLVASCVSR